MPPIVLNCVCKVTRFFRPTKFFLIFFVSRRNASDAHPKTKLKNQFRGARQDLRKEDKKMISTCGRTVGI